ncbi:MAG: relaxase/mobilization nuclease domain-containing protein [Methylotenera sp.]|nr:relaxase/mobilization nuclease domain-containing protein [Flavobacterium sp.]
MNNSATTRTISKIALEYNGNDKGLAKLATVHFLLGINPEDQFQEMKAVADRNPKVKKWALTGYISPPEEIGKSLSDSELTGLAIEALRKVGVTDLNQFRLDIHNSTKQKHIHFIVNRINIHGKCTVKAHDVGKRFGEAVRQICLERNLKTDVEIGIEKRAAMLKNLTEVIRQTNNFDDLISEMKDIGYVVQLSKNEKIGISGMRIILASDINHQTQRQYKPGYKLSEISNILKIDEIKNIFEIKSALQNELKYNPTLKDLRENVFKKGWYLKIQYKEEFKPNQKNEIQDFKIIGVGLSKKIPLKDGYFYDKREGLSLSEIDSAYNDLTKGISATAELKSTVDIASFVSKSTMKETLKEVTEELLDDFLKPNYVAKEDEWWKKKRKNRR